MDIARSSEFVERRRRRRIAVGVAIVLLVGVTSVVLAGLKPAAPTVESGGLWIDSVKRGSMLRQVRGVGMLVPDEIRWITALTEGRVDRVLVRPGTAVTPETILLELSNPQAEQAALTAALDLKSAIAQYEVLKADLARDLLAQRATAADVAADSAEAEMDASAAEAMAEKGFIPAIQLQRSKLLARTAAERKRMEDERLQHSEKTLSIKLEVQQAEVERRKTLADLRRAEASSLRVAAGVAGVLQEVPVEVGQRIGSGANLARVVDPTRLKAQLQIAETQVKDVVIGQKAQIDTRNGVTQGRVVRIDPSARNGNVTVEVAFDGELPKGARPDMSVDGTVELERLDGILYVGRPALGHDRGKVGLFKLSPDRSTASLAAVELGRSSVNTIEVVGGLNEGDCVVLSDMSQWDGHDRLRLSGTPACAAR